ncbi:hypothetical protein AB1K09_16065 [Solibacillus silvestris]
MKVYLSGKVRGNNWRAEIYEDLSSLIQQDELEKDGYIYHGPFIDSIELSNEMYGGEDIEDIKRSIYSQSDRRIQQSEAVFVWIDQTDIYRVLYEIICAHFHKKYVFVGIKQTLKEFASEIYSFLNHIDHLVYTDNALEAWEQFVECGPRVEKMRATEKQINYIRNLSYQKNLKPIKFEENFTKGEAGKIIAFLTQERYKERYEEEVKQYFTIDPYTVDDIKDIFVLEESEIKKRIIDEYRWPPTTYVEKIEQLKKYLRIQMFCENSEYFKTINQRKIYNGLWLIKVDEYYGNEKPVYSEGEFQEIIEKEKCTTYSKVEFENLLKRTQVVRNGKYSRKIEGKGRYYSNVALERVLDIILKEGIYYDYVKMDFKEEELNMFKYTFNDVEKIIMKECFVTRDEFKKIYYLLSERYKVNGFVNNSEYHQTKKKSPLDWGEIFYNEKWLELLKKFISDTKMIYTLDMLRDEVGRKKHFYSKSEFERIVRNSRVRKDRDCYKEFSKGKKLFSPKAVQIILGYLSNSAK